jgi:hypothetical protein
MVSQSSRDSLTLTQRRNTLVHATMVITSDFAQYAPLLTRNSREAGFDALEKIDAAIVSLCEFVKQLDGDADAVEEKKEKIKINVDAT